MTDILDMSVSTPCTQSQLAQLSPFSLFFPASKPFNTNKFMGSTAFTTFCHTTSAILHQKSFATQFWLFQRNMHLYKGCWAHPAYQMWLSLIGFKSVKWLSPVFTALSIHICIHPTIHPPQGFFKAPKPENWFVEQQSSMGIVICVWISMAMGEPGIAHLVLRLQADEHHFHQQLLLIPRLLHFPEGCMWKQHNKRLGNSLG